MSWTDAVDARFSFDLWRDGRLVTGQRRVDTC